MARGSNREWGYASYNVDDEDDERLTYTSYEKDKSVNRYTDNGDGGHSHSHWDSANDYNSGETQDSGRTSSNRHKNPTTGEIQGNGGCYLTSACMHHFSNDFDDNCYELRVLRWFRDNYVLYEDIKKYYQVAPLIVEDIESCKDKDLIYDYIYDNIVDYCVEQIENGNYEEAYTRYKSSIISLEDNINRNKVLVRA